MVHHLENRDHLRVKSRQHLQTVKSPTISMLLVYTSLTAFFYPVENLLKNKIKKKYLPEKPEYDKSCPKRKFWRKNGTCTQF